MEDQKLKFSLPALKRGLTIKFAIDGTYCGWEIVLKKHRFEVNLGWFAVRVYFLSEENVDSMMALLIFNKICTSHSIDITKAIKDANKKRRTLKEPI